MQWPVPVLHDSWNFGAGVWALARCLEYDNMAFASILYVLAIAELVPGIPNSIVTNPTDKKISFFSCILGGP